MLRNDGWVVALLLAGLGVLWGGCGGSTTADCSADNCNGCCDVQGQCTFGSEAAACGVRGARCAVCEGGRTCSGGACLELCEPATCASLDARCGPVADGCGGTLSCGNCPQGFACGIERPECFSTDAGCKVATCQGRCGTVDDGCGGALECGACQDGGCLSAAAACAAAQAECGAVSNGCGLQVLCGTCSVGQECGAGGPSRCGILDAGCTPKDCAGLGATCGEVSDGCGQVLSCGECNGWLTCGGGGGANTCGAVCDLSCPSGFSCDASGVCQGASSGSLGLDVREVSLGGKVTLNGGLPGSNCGFQPRGWVLFDDLERGYSQSLAISCNGGNTPFSFSGKFYPGTYRVRVRGGQSDLPPEPLLVDPAFVVHSASSPVFDVRTLTLAGRVTLNDQQPTSDCLSSDRAHVELFDASNGSAFAIPIPCNGRTSPLEFSRTVYPGKYRVTVRGDRSSLPAQAFLVQPSLVLTTGTVNLPVDVKTHGVSGTVLLGGQVPGGTCFSDRGTVELEDGAQGYLFELPIPCSGSGTAFTWAGQVFPGTYRVTVLGGSSLLPKTGYVVRDGLLVSGPASGVVLDLKLFPVSGKVTLNTNLPTTTCVSADRGTVTFEDPDFGYRFVLPIPCNSRSAPLTYAGDLYPGTYRVTVNGQDSQLPSEPFLAHAALPVQTALTALDLDVKTVDVSGVVTLNGQPPIPNCTSSEEGTVEWVEKEQGYRFELPIPCTAAATPLTFGGSVYPGSYEVRVRGAESNLPKQAFVVEEALAVVARQSGLAFDVKTVNVLGAVTLEGLVPSPSCYSLDLGTVVFEEVRYGYRFELPIPCSAATTFAFAAPVFPGIYKVSVSGGYSTLPEGPVVVIERLEVK